MISDWIGKPYKDKGRGPDGWDCWGLVRAILMSERGITLPDYADAYITASDRYSVSQAVQAGLEHGWARVTKPKAFDLLILRIAGRPWHCAIMLNDRQFIHVPPPSRTGI